MFGREEIMGRLTTIFEPAEEVRTVVLYGPSGIGKSAIASDFADRQINDRKTVWVSFAYGPERALQAISDALLIENEESPFIEPKNSLWVQKTLKKLAKQDVLMIAEDVESVPEADLPFWLPKGSGNCAVLVVSQRPERLLQRELGAISLSTKPLHISALIDFFEDGKDLLESPPSILEIADLCNAAAGSPTAVGYIFCLLKKAVPISEIVPLAARTSDKEKALLARLLSTLTPLETFPLYALSVSAPTGTPERLLFEMALHWDESFVRPNPPEDLRPPHPLITAFTPHLIVPEGPNGVTFASIEAILERFVRFSLIERLPYGVRILKRARSEIIRSPQARAALEIIHAIAAQVFFQSASDSQKTEAAVDTFLATQRLTDHVAGLFPSSERERLTELLQLTDLLATQLWESKGGVRRENAQSVLRAFQAILKKQDFLDPDECANVFEKLGRLRLDLSEGTHRSQIEEAIQAFENARTLAENNSRKQRLTEEIERARKTLQTI